MIAEGSAAAKGLSTARIRRIRPESRCGMECRKRQTGIPVHPHILDDCGSAALRRHVRNGSPPAQCRIGLTPAVSFHASRRVVRASDEPLAKKEGQDFVGASQRSATKLLHQSPVGGAFFFPLPLLRLVGVAGVDLLQIDHLSLNIEPEAAIAFERRLVLPPIMRGGVAGHPPQIALRPGS
jgi:hypothetical protein